MLTMMKCYPKIISINITITKIIFWIKLLNNKTFDDTKFHNINLNLTSLLNCYDLYLYKVNSKYWSKINLITKKMSKAIKWKLINQLTSIAARNVILTIKNWFYLRINDKKMHWNS